MPRREEGAGAMGDAARNSESALDGRYLFADTNARGARDGIALTTQTAYMRRMGEENGWKPALILVVVDETHLAEAGQRIRTALNGDADPEREIGSAA